MMLTTINKLHGEVKGKMMVKWFVLFFVVGGLAVILFSDNPTLINPWPSPKAHHDKAY